MLQQLYLKASRGVLSPIQKRAGPLYGLKISTTFGGKFQSLKVCFRPTMLLSLIFISSLDDKNYQLWRGIVAYFKPNGFLEKHHIPSHSSPDYDERCATYVTQNVLLNRRTAITQFLILIAEDETA